MSLKITNATAARPTVWLYGDIGAFFGGISADDFRKALAEIPTTKEIELHIHSEGGIFFDGVAMHSTLRQRRGAVHVIVDGIAASAASIVAMAGTTVQMATHAWLMIHEARSGGEGTAEELRAEADRLDQINSEITRIYSGRWKGSEKELANAIAAETWYPADEAVAMGLADSIIDTAAVAARVDPKRYAYKHVPEPLVAKAGECPKLEERKAIITELFPMQEAEPCESK